MPAQAGIHLMLCHVYIMASKPRGTLYTGVTRDLVQRVWQHKSDVVEGFTKRYQVHRLVWYESTPYLLAAIQRERQIKAWKRQWKIELIEKSNPQWKDLFADLV